MKRVASKIITTLFCVVALTLNKSYQQQQQQRESLVKILSHKAIKLDHTPSSANTVYPEKVCFGTNNKLSKGGDSKHTHIQSLRDRYTNCTYVDGNLEITWVEADQDLSFLQSIREVTGYVLLGFIDVERVELINLSIIRGRETFTARNGEEFSLLITRNAELRYLELPSLQDILIGSVGIFDNHKLCYVDSISWYNIIDDTSKYNSTINSSSPKPAHLTCPACHSSCKDQGCWSERPHMCQQVQHQSCHHQCPSKRCYGPGHNQCCHSFCVGGCRGPTERDCFACRNFNNDGECMSECPSMERYNPNLFQWEPNPKGRYAHGSSCVKECPAHLLRDNSACVKKCPPNKRNMGDECISCSGPCPKDCQGVDIINSANIEQLRGCTTIEGSINILETSFTGYTDFHPTNNTPKETFHPMNPSSLDVLKTIREITGYLNIQANHRDFENLHFLRNLEVIGGRQTTDMFALSIIKTSLKSLNLKSLKKIRAGGIHIENNKELCFAETLNWDKLNITSGTVKNHIVENKDIDMCKKEGQQCHDQCSEDGCSGPGQDECFSCRNYKFEDYCVSDCAATSNELNLLSYDAANSTCMRCNNECQDGCRDSTSVGCLRCKNAKDGPHCVSECPGLKYNLHGICQDCDKSCIDGCSGPSNRLGPKGCRTCGKAIINSTDSTKVSYCVKSEDPCPDGFYTEYVGAHTKIDNVPNYPIGRPICRRCHPQCKTCSGKGTHKSVCECAKYLAGEQCEDKCPRDSYADERTHHCFKCSPVCMGCRGPTEADCESCRGYKLFFGDSVNIDGESYGGRFNCTDECPTHKPYRRSGTIVHHPYCSDRSDDSWLVVICILLTVLVTVCIVVLGLYRWCQLAKDKTMKLTMQLSGINGIDIEPTTPSFVKPNMREVRIIQETELRKGNLLGSGFGGSVYQGSWVPKNGTGPHPVAIKVLRDHGNSNMSKEFLEEAYTMALAQHPNLVQLLGVCMTRDQMMLVTQLMPLGCLLDYVINNKDKVGSKNLLEWSKQVAVGMAYLEQNRIVHRDLALRNVLLQTTGRALISDFGLAKLLEIDESEYHSSEGRLPIKWLAPECIKEKIFTHKSDVWAFGVTIWELLTYGGKPFDEYETEKVPAAIEAGARLKQPSHVSAEVYKVMLACWVPNPDGRPNFRDLSQMFAKFAQDPERYLMAASKGFEYTNLHADEDDYLVPSPSSKGPESLNSFLISPNEKKLFSTAPSTPSKFHLQPPHSAGPFRVENEEYFFERMKYGSMATERNAFIFPPPRPQN